MSNEINFIKEHIDILQDYFLKHDGWACNKDNIEDVFDSWLQYQDIDTLQAIVLQMQTN